MRRFQVLGANADTGQDLQLLVEAASPDEAAHLARTEYNMLVSEVQELPAPSPAAPEAVPSVGSGPVRPASPILDYRTPSHPQPKSPVPHYGALLWAGRYFRAGATVWYLLAIVCLLATTVRGAFDFYDVLRPTLPAPFGMTPLQATLTVIVGLVGSYVLGLIGLFIHVQGEKLQALRDLARNSFGLQKP